MNVESILTLIAGGLGFLKMIREFRKSKKAVENVRHLVNSQLSDVRDERDAARQSIDELRSEVSALKITVDRLQRPKLDG